MTPLLTQALYVRPAQI